LVTWGEWKSVFLEGLYRELPDDEKDRSEDMYTWRLPQERGNWCEPGACSLGGHAHSDVQTPPIFQRVEIHKFPGRRAAVA
jgi:nitroimidazol reductase NimA-like FMN-containing flavoprotein (pyridoxamine 5'-phosphate oxidase superfamily)